MGEGPPYKTSMGSTGLEDTETRFAKESDEGGREEDGRQTRIVVPV